MSRISPLRVKEGNPPDVRIPATLVKTLLSFFFNACVSTCTAKHAEMSCLEALRLCMILHQPHSSVDDSSSGGASLVAASAALVRLSRS